MANPVRPDMKEIRQRRYLAKDFDSLRSTLVDYARTYYPSATQDFSENGLGGMLLDFATAVGDNMSFYLDHQYGELDPSTAVELSNIERMLQRAGVPITGASPAVVQQTFYVKVPAAQYTSGPAPFIGALPIIRSFGTIVSSNTGVQYTLLEDLDFRLRTSSGDLIADVRIGDRSPSGAPQNYILSLSGICVSGSEATKTVSIGSSFVPFRKIKLDFPDVSQIMKVYDADGNTYYEVSALTNDVVYKNLPNNASDSAQVDQIIQVVPAPYRFIKTTDLATRSTTLTFGGGSSISPDDDALPDPLDFAISLPYSTTFSRVSINPNQLLSTRTLGTAKTNTVLTIVYRYGGGANHNSPTDTIRNITSLVLDMPGVSTAAQQAFVRASVETTNKKRAVGGASAPTVDDLKSLIPSMANSQERIVTKPDLLSRIYTLPPNFGRVFRAAVRANQHNPLATQLFVVSRDQDGLVMCTDTLKKNLVTYLQPYRMISDAIDILDASVVNFKIDFEVSVDPVLNKNVILQNILTNIKTYFDRANFQIDQPINLSEVNSLITSVGGVQSVSGIKFTCLSGIVDGRNYSTVTYDMQVNTVKSFIFPPDGGIFELKYPEKDLSGKAN